MTASPARQNLRRQKSLDLDDLFDAIGGYETNDGSKSVSHLGQALRKFQEGQEAAAAHRGEHDLMARSVATTGGALRSQGRRGRKKRITSSSGASVISAATATVTSATIITPRKGNAAAENDDDGPGDCTADSSDGITIFTAPTSSQQQHQSAASSNLMNFLSYTNDSEKEDNKLALDVPPGTSTRTRRRGSKRMMSSSASCAPDIMLTNQPSPLRASLSLGSSGLASMAQQATCTAAVDRSKLRERMRRERSNDRTSSSRMQNTSLRSTVSLSGAESHSSRSSHQQHHRRKTEREISDPHLLKATANVSSRMRMSSHARTRSHSDAEFSFANKDNSHPPITTRRNSKSLHGRTLSKSPHREKNPKGRKSKCCSRHFFKIPHSYEASSWRHG